MRRLREACWVLALLLLAAQPTPIIAQSSIAAEPAQSEAPSVDPVSVAPPPGGDDAQALAKKLANPIASLISLPIQANYDWSLGANDEGTNFRLNIQPVVPIKLSENWNLISRTIVPVIVQNKVLPTMPNGDDDQSGIGDVTQSFFFSPQKPTSGGIIWGAGPVLYLATATDHRIGAQKWGVGPTAVALKQSHGWTFGALVNHIWSVAGDDDRDKISTTFLQPFVSYATPTAMTFSVNTETSYDWVHNEWTVPVNLAVAQLLGPKLTGMSFPIQVQIGWRHYFEQAPGGPRERNTVHHYRVIPGIDCWH